MKLLYAILVVAFVFRLASLTFGLPYADVYGDEIAHVVMAFKAMNAKTLFINYGDSFLPPLFSYLLIPVYGGIGLLGKLFHIFSSFGDYKEFVILQKEWFLMPARIISAIFGTATIYFLYLLAERIFNKKTALLAAFFLAIDFLHIHDSQIGHIWSPIVFFIVAGLYACYSLYLTGQRKWYVYSALCAAFGYAIGQVPLAIFIFVIVAHYAFVRKNGGRFLNKNLLISCAVTVGLFGLFTYLNFYTVYKHFIEVTGIVLKIFGVDFEAAEKISEVAKKASISGGFSVAFKTIFYTAPALFVFGILGSLFYLAKKRYIECVFLIVLPIAYILFFIFSTHLTYRYVLPIIPFMAVFASYFIFYFSEIFQKKWRMAVLISGIILVSFYSLTSSILYSYKLLRPYTVSQAVEWLYANVPSGNRIVSNIYLNSDKESIKFVEKNNEFNWLDSRKKFLLGLNGEKYPQPNYFLIDTNLTDVSKLTKEERTARYFLLFFYGKEAEEKNLKIMEQFPGKKELVAGFYPMGEKAYIKDLINFEPHWVISDVFKLKNIGPNTEIYKNIKQ